ncbi:MAG: 4-(cytidine 5'-diphospho)-2-C-methyl-D-erythritol kinase [Bacteroidetes bacterium]|nr:4-(cytidine 5'-diphospho)-2-C-methyl-D-erythritol kinase [Bacteroidota bacterium]MDA0904579.1 4-(cytidine 5'-diphospho)-2-C-methyl-D-erythritol kinase [Bacteroidota bacterium]MDA1243308.1 4-(cytidine 5'-diphospho)-2-C-methyl-D-erythritol kinase [Bacteroidota bacterium]
MVLFPPAKLNLGLHVVGKRPDGYHNLESIFVPLGWTDVLEVLLDQSVPQGTLKTTWTGLPIPGEESGNLIVKAHQLLAQGRDLPGMTAHLHKVLPMGAGLGGGSADGTYMLRAVNELCELGLTRETLMELAAQLGSDCAFFVGAVPALVTGRGEHVSPVRATWAEGLWVVVCNPGIHISTAEAFEGLTPGLRKVEWEALLHQPVSSWSDEIQNDFETGACTRHPEILDLLQSLRKAGAAYVQMTGSGSTVFGLFEDEAQAQNAGRNLAAGYCGPLGAPQC